MDFMKHIVKMIGFGLHIVQNVIGFYRCWEEIECVDDGVAGVGKLELADEEDGGCILFMSRALFCCDISERED